MSTFATLEDLNPADGYVTQSQLTVITNDLANKTKQMSRFAKSNEIKAYFDVFSIEIHKKLDDKGPMK